MHASTSSTTPRGTPSRRGKSPRFPADGHIPTTSSPTFNSLSNKQLATFLSSVDIPVEGVKPIEPESGMRSASAAPEPQASSEAKRAPRKSKTDALAAMSTQSRASSPGGDDGEQVENLAARYQGAPPIPVPAALDLSTVKTPRARTPQDLEKPPRPFGLEDCPEYFPTLEEFKDPMAYIKSIAPRAKQYGICKIVPPEGWKMPFVVDTKEFRFKTRRQKLNNIEASARAKVTFLEQLYRFHHQQGNPNVSIPTINHKPLDLWLLRKEVHKLGGYDAVCKGRKWSDLGRLLGYRGAAGLSTQIKNSYTRVILPFEQFCERARNSPAAAARDPDVKMHSEPDPQDSGNTQSAAKTNGHEIHSPPGSPLTSSSSPLSEPPDEADSKEPSGKPPSRPRRSIRLDSHDGSPAKAKPGVTANPLKPPVFYDKHDDSKSTASEVRILQGRKRPSPNFNREQESCEICHKQSDGNNMLLCDGCDGGFHYYCLDPPLAGIPHSEQWYCYNCLSGTGADFGFDEGEEHTLSTFQARDLEFRRLWFERHPPTRSPLLDKHNHIMVNRVGDVTYSEYDVEEEFWRLVQSPSETVEVEYGADVHSTTHGSAMPTLEAHPLDPYSKDPWNLNNIPILPDSLLRFIKSDISGMTVPWIYVGMAFSTFCWHNEDHYTYSINFMHWGETKTWYGIPGSDAEKFETAIKCEAPDLFEAQPDLLFQLVTLMNPKLVTEAGVRVYGCNQRAGEFVITFPKAYHAGFNHGLNFNEAVNFALPDWLPSGLDCVQRYRLFRKHPVFSHDELLITITEQVTSIKTALWLMDSLEEMRARELANREKARKAGVTTQLEKGEKDQPEEQYQCHVCKVFLYLSQITCPCSTRAVCADHLHLLCENHTPGHAILRLRMDDDAVVAVHAQVAQRASVPVNWRNKLNRLLQESAKPSLRSLRALVAEGDRISYPLPEMTNLRKCVQRANEWVDAANSFLTRKGGRRRSRKSKSRHSEAPNGAEDADRQQELGLDDLHSLLAEVEDLGFECSEIGALQSLAQKVETLKEEAAQLLQVSANRHDDEAYRKRCRNVVDERGTLSVYLPEIDELDKAVRRWDLLEDLKAKLSDSDSLELDDVRELFSRAKACGLSTDHELMQQLHSRHNEGIDWEGKAKAVLEKSPKTLDDLNQFAELPSSVPTDASFLPRLLAARTKALDYEKQAQAWLDCENGAQARIQDVVRLTNRASKDFDIYSVNVLKRSAEIASDLENRCEAVLRNKHTEEKDVFDAVERWSAYAKEHLRMFVLPNMEKVEQQLKEHQEWLEKLPWYCANHKGTHVDKILQDVIDSTNPDEDLPPADEYYTCLCHNPVRPPPAGVQSDAVQCEYCFARFHGQCATTGGSCPFCDRHHWDGTVTKERPWHFCFLPNMLITAPDISRFYSPDYKTLEIIVHRIDRLATVIGQFLAFTAIEENQRLEYIPQTRHFMRKLFKIQFVVSPNPNVSFGLDLAGLHRILAGRPQATKPKKRRRPKFTFVQDIDKDAEDGTRCICSGKSAYLVRKCPTLTCGHCNRRYHIICTFLTDKATNSYMCPLCCVRKGKPYPYAEIRVKPAGECSFIPSTCSPLTPVLGALAESLPHETDLYVNTREMVETFSKDIILKKEPMLFTQHITLDLVSWSAGSDTATTTTSMPRPQPPLPAPVSQPLPPAHYAPGGHHTFMAQPPQSAMPIIHHAAPSSIGTFSIGTPSHGPPPPPWSRWGAITTPNVPPSTQRRSQNGDSGGRLNGTPPHQHQQPSAPGSASSSRKRKHADEPTSRPASASDRGSAGDSSWDGPFPLKRHAGPSLTPTPTSPPRQAQTLSPSLAMIVSPTNLAVHTSPRGPSGHHLPSTMRNGASGSPVLPPLAKNIIDQPSRGPPEPPRPL